MPPQGADGCAARQVHEHVDRAMHEVAVADVSQHDLPALGVELAESIRALDRRERVATPGGVLELDSVRLRVRPGHVLGDRFREGGELGEQLADRGRPFSHSGRA